MREQHVVPIDASRLEQWNDLPLEVLVFVFEELNLVADDRVGEVDYLDSQRRWKCLRESGLLFYSIRIIGFILKEALNPLEHRVRQINPLTII